MERNLEQAALLLAANNHIKGGFGNGADIFTASSVLAIIYTVSKEEALDVLVQSFDTIAKRGDNSEP